MTDFTNNRFLNHIKDFIEDKNWYAGQVIKKAGRFPLGKIPNSQEYIQLDKLYALGATIKKSDKRDFPPAGITEMKSMLRKLKWFNSLVEWTEEQYEDYTSGNDYEVERTKKKIDAVDYKFDYDMEIWFVGYGTTFTSDLDYDERWIPWMKAKASTAGTGTMSDPGDLNDKVTNTAGTTGTTATILNMVTKLTSLTTNQTIDFARKTFGPVKRAMSLFKDSNTGRQMAEPHNSDAKKVANATYQVHVAPELAEEFENIKVFDGEKYLDRSIADDMRAMGLEIVVNRQFTALLVEENGAGAGVCQFGMTCDFESNFQVGIAQKIIWEADKRIPGIKDKWIKRVTSRYVPYTHPYYDGSKWYKAFFHGYFYYMDDT